MNMKEKELILILEDIRSLWNVGAMFRAADALGVAKIYLCGVTGKPPRGEISKVALGAEAWVPWEYHAAAWELVQKLKKKGYQTTALEQVKGSTSLKDFTPKFPLALVVGNERHGISKETLDAVEHIVHIPMVGRKESLNVSVAAGIAVYGLLS